MSLIVAAVEGDGLYAAAESMLTWTNDAERTSQVWTQPWRKLQILRADLFVGITGSAFFEASEHLARAGKDGTARTVEWAAVDLADCDVLIGSLNPARLVRARYGERMDLTRLGRAWAGDPEAYIRFEALEHPVFGGAADLGLQAPMQSLASLYRTPSVGGYVTQLVTTNGGFGYRATPIAIFGGVEACVVVGVGGTPGALAIHVPRLRTGYLYCQDTPWLPVEVPASRCEDLVAFASEARGQTLAIRTPCGHLAPRFPG